MKLLKIFAIAAAFVFLTVTVSFALPDQEQRQGAEKGDKVIIKHGKYHEFDKDPVKVLEGRKEKVQSLLREGKITKQQADDMTTRIDEKIARIKEFQKLTLPQKREKLKENFKASADRLVNEGRITRERADEMIKEFNEKISKWDGTGYPGMHVKWFKEGKHHMKEKPGTQKTMT